MDRIKRLNLIEWFLLAVLLSLVLIGCLSIPFSIWWQAENVQNQSKTIVLNDNTKITVDYPALVLIEDKPAPFSFSLSVTDPLTQPLTITVQLPLELVVAIPAQTYRDFEPHLTFEALTSRVQTQTMQIANARLVWGWEQAYTIVLTATICSYTQTDTLPLKIEGTWRASLRGFLANQWNLVVTALFTSVGLIYTFFEKRREAEEKVRERKVEEERREREEKNKQANCRKEKFRQLMRQQNFSLAQQTLHSLKEQSLLEFIEPDDRAWMEHLSQWSEGNLLAELNIETVPENWLNEVAGALVYAFHQGQGKAPEIKSLLRQLPMDKLAGNVWNAVQAAIALPEQSPRWPLRPEKPNLDLIALSDPWKERLPFNPFPYEYAEDDFPLLFSEVGAFWNEHPVYKRAVATSKTEIIAGESGAGKTAMALALGEYGHDNNKETLACYLVGLPEERDIQQALAKKILTFVCRHPTFLRKLGQDSRVLLARVCTAALGTHYVLAVLDSVPIEKIEYVQQESDPNNRRIRENIIRSQLRLLRNIIISLPADQPHTFDGWGSALAECARVLGFTLPIRVVIDTSGKRCAEWINENILPRASAWRRHGIIAKIFVSAHVGSAIEVPTDHLGWLVFSELKWDTPLMSQMLDHRFENMMAAKDRRVVRRDIASDELWEQMISKARCNPRCFIRLWNRMLDLATDGVLNGQVLGKALEGFECP